MPVPLTMTIDNDDPRAATMIPNSMAGVRVHQQAATARRKGTRSLSRSQPRLRAFALNLGDEPNDHWPHLCDMVENPRVPACALGDAHISGSLTDTLHEWRRCAPHGSLPPCGGGTGRGVGDEAPSARLVSCKKSRERQLAAFVRSRLRTDAALLYPSPCPSPTRGEGTLWPRSAQLQTSIRVDVCIP
jgi:hypothetical protein